jgi:nitrogen regulatory protein P-II 1
MRYTPEYNPRTKIEVIIRDDQVDGLIHKIADKLRTINIVGKIFVLDVPIALDIRTNKTGKSAL